MLTPMFAVSDVIWQAAIAAFVTLVVAWMNKHTNKKLDVIHDLSNSAMGTQKRLLAVSLRAHAHLTGLKVDMEAATAAENDLADHEERQRKADETEAKQ